MPEKKFMFAMILLTICILAGAFGQISWKHAMSNMEKIDDVDGLLRWDTISNIITDKYIILGLLLYGSAFFLWLSALSTLDVSFMYPMLSLAYVLTAILAFVFLGEQVSLLRWSGILLVVLGCVLIMKS
jgi:multidrug transporter EmrE-like cation transporter